MFQRCNVFWRKSKQTSFKAFYNPSSNISILSSLNCTLKSLMFLLKLQRGLSRWHFRSTAYERGTLWKDSGAAEGLMVGDGLFAHKIWLELIRL